ncbi:MAG: hypothetical protein ACK4NA_12705 [Alphaproteobacteria bacterium]
MLLRDEIKSRGLTLERAAIELGTSAPVLSRAMRRVPRPTLVTKIYIWSEGRVDANSFYNFPPLPGHGSRGKGNAAGGVISARSSRKASPCGARVAADAAGGKRFRAKVRT